MIWFSADYHLGHKNIMKYSNRPFKSVSEMDQTIIDNLEEKIKSRDTLYFLGDLTFNPEKALEFFERFQDLEIHLILGNHDYNSVIKIAENFCNSISQLKDIKIDKSQITLCHYAMRVWNKSHFNAWQLHGHSHGKLPSIGKQYDVGIDSNNYYPISYEELIEIMNNKENNVNYINNNK